MDAVGNCPCNPSIGGTAKGHLVREIDALGGEMGKAADDCFLQSRMLNKGKGPAVHSLRCQADKMEYSKEMKKVLEHQNHLTIKQAEVSEILFDDITEDGYIHKITGVKIFSGITYEAKAVILAMGCRERTRGALVIPGTRPAGIFTAGSAQRFVNIDGYLPGKKVVILGSGDIGLIMARRLTLEGAEVKLICELMPFSAGLRRNIVQCVENFNIPLKFSHTITKIHGKERVEGVSVAAVDKNRRPIPETEEFIECDTLLLSVGLIPENEISNGCGISIDSTTSGPVVNEHMQTSVEGIFACGNTVHVHDLVDFVTAESIRAGENAAKYVQGAKAKNPKNVVLRPGNRVRYTVPQHIESTESETPISIMFRPTDVYRNVQIVAYSNNERIKAMKKKIVRPGEMQVLELNPEQLAKVHDNLTVSIEIPEEDMD